MTDRARMHFMSPASCERALETMGVEEDGVFSLMLLAETYGSVSVPRFDVTDDAWGKWYSLSLTHPKGTSEWVLVIEDHYGY